MIGDRRTGALVAADGTLNWFCVPEFDGTPIFGALLDPERAQLEFPLSERADFVGSVQWQLG